MKKQNIDIAIKKFKDKLIGEKCQLKKTIK